MAGMQKDCRSNPCQRHGSALNLNVHLHILALDGVYTFAGERPRLHRVAPPAGEELERLLDALICRTWMYQCREAQGCARAAGASLARSWPLSASCLPRHSYIPVQHARRAGRARL
jgi:hypothetical protein